MCYFMFFGIGFIFIVPLFSLTKRRSSLCYVRRFIMAISFIICSAPLLMKMWRIHDIFKNANQLRRMSPIGLIGRGSLLFITVPLTAMQVHPCALMFNTAPPDLVEKFYLERNNFERSVFMLNCTFYAFLTRHFPKKFDEAMYIGITMYLTCAVWIMFFATFLNMDYSIFHVYWISGSSLVISWVTLGGFFSPKLYHLIMKKKFSQEMLLSWGDSTFPKAESSVDVSVDCPRCKLRDSEI